MKSGESEDGSGDVDHGIGTRNPKTMEEMMADLKARCHEKEGRDNAWRRPQTAAHAEQDATGVSTYVSSARQQTL